MIICPDYGLPASLLRWWLVYWRDTACLPLPEECCLKIGWSPGIRNKNRRLLTERRFKWLIESFEQNWDDFLQSQVSSFWMRRGRKWDFLQRWCMRLHNRHQQLGQNHHQQKYNLCVLPGLACWFDREVFGMWITSMAHSKLPKKAK